MPDQAAEAVPVMAYLGAAADDVLVQAVTTAGGALVQAVGAAACLVWRWLEDNDMLLLHHLVMLQKQGLQQCQADLVLSSPPVQRVEAA